MGLLVNASSIFDLTLAEKRLGTVLLLYEIIIKGALGQVCSNFSYSGILPTTSITIDSHGTIATQLIRNMEYGRLFYASQVNYIKMIERSLQYPDEDKQVLGLPI